MRKRKIVKIDDREVTILELRTKDWRKLFADLENLGQDGLKGHLEEVLSLATDLTLDDLDEMAPSEIDLIWEAFEEVNKSFFGKLRKMGISEKFLFDWIAETFKKELTLTSSTGPSAISSFGGIETPGNTDGPSS
jgi:hypothetical protein